MYSKEKKNVKNNITFFLILKFSNRFENHFFFQHDCQEFLLLLFETLRKQMPISKSEALESYYYGTASLSSEMSSSSDQHTGSRNSSSPTPPNSPVSASSYKQYSRSDTQEVIMSIYNFFFWKRNLLEITDFASISSHFMVD